MSICPTDISNVNFGDGLLYGFFPHYSNTSPGVLTLSKWYISGMKTLERPKHWPASLTTTSVTIESECAPSNTNIGWVGGWPEWHTRSAWKFLTRHIDQTWWDALRVVTRGAWWGSSGPAHSQRGDQRKARDRTFGNCSATAQEHASYNASPQVWSDTLCVWVCGCVGRECWTVCWSGTTLVLE